MSKVYYKRKSKINKKNIFRFLSLSIFLSGLLIIVYVFLPLFSWQFYFGPAFANQAIATPIPRDFLVNNMDLNSLISEASNSLTGVDYTNAQNWFPAYKHTKNGLVKVKLYSISIPKIKLKNAIVSTVDTDLANHLVNFEGTSIPSEKGNAVVFGHSTLPQLYNPKNYKTIFTYLYKLNPGDEIIVTVDNKQFKYRIQSLTVVDANDKDLFEQNFSDSYLTLVTCTPPGTIWKRLVVKSKIEV